MSRSAITFVLFATTAACSAAPTVDEELVAEDQAALPVDPTLEPVEKQCPLSAFDFALTPDDHRTCADFTFSTKAGRWTSGYTFAAAPAGIKERRCHVAFRGVRVGGSCALPNQADLKLNCSEALSLATAKRVATVLPIMFDSYPSPVKPADVPLTCGKLFPTGVMQTKSYTGGCTSCGSISGRTLFVNFPSDFTVVTYWDSGAARSIAFQNLGAPIQYTLPGSPNAAAGVVVSQ